MEKNWKNMKHGVGGKVAALLSATVIATSPVIANAQTLTAPGQAEVEFTATIGSTFSVSAPAEYDVTNNATTVFEITASGNIAGNEVLKIEGPDSVDMEQEGKDPVTATVEMSKTEFSSAELAADGGSLSEVSVTVEGLSAGEWSATATFVVTLEEIEDETP